MAVHHGPPAAKPQGGDRRAGRIDTHAAFILDAIEAKDDITLVELQALLAEQGTLSGSARCGGSSTGTGSRAKKTVHATEQDRPDVLKRREGWFDLDSERLVFIDETWAPTNMAGRHGRCGRCERLRSGVPHGHWKTTTPSTSLSTGFVAGLRRSGMVAPMVLDGSINRDAFVAYVRQVLVPDLSRRHRHHGQLVEPQACPELVGGAPACEAIEAAAPSCSSSRPAALTPTRLNRPSPS